MTPRRITDVHHSTGLDPCYQVVGILSEPSLSVHHGTIRLLR